MQNTSKACPVRLGQCNPISKLKVVFRVFSQCIRNGPTCGSCARGQVVGTEPLVRFPPFYEQFYNQNGIQLVEFVRHEAKVKQSDPNCPRRTYCSC